MFSSGYVAPNKTLLVSLGQFNALSIQISFTVFVYPALIFAYLGQGARLIVSGEHVISNIFYQTIPGRPNGPIYWISFVFALLATVCLSAIYISLRSSCGR
jgi:KUP system potassium uptake protein